MPPRRTSPRARSARLALTAAVAALGLTLAGCDSGGRSEASGAGTPSGGPSVIAPGRPGEAARTLSPRSAKDQADVAAPNSADFGYVRMMIAHHEQALTMTGLAKGRADSSVERLAERIAASQGPEIDAMRGWQKTHDDSGGGAAHDHAAMPGMATEAQLRALRAAKGKAFDELFLKLMIAHHGGAVTMATEVLSDGNNVLVEEMANDVVSQQTSEINRMRGMI
ncbi:DUF305 domain-containing protein [Streptomyces tsukubensis]|uniref:DUF305 domain-containing protein n=1 Tax=Streptomyces tsukubensis TaxID=83656 RepID=A0A1V4A018_9ACTN|nr:DUF305 domain-containing protein [Streptomyces tsukubensis]OON71797.1 DUF305 domain-containing protein [Streptomyces tsukubensis]QFR97012.1 DUF305 domain-containing protein [Streptomyces tsukubensis]